MSARRRPPLPAAMLRAMIQLSQRLPPNHPLRQRTEAAVANGDPVARYVPPPQCIHRTVRSPLYIESVTTVDSDQPQCPVCLELFTEGQARACLPKCQHAFHHHCIAEWCKKKANCPMCRTPL